MKKTILSLLGVVAVLAVAAGCTENQRARTFGGTMTVTLPAGQKLVNATWKQDNLFYLTRPMRTNETAETFTFKEDSSWGIIEGDVIFVETKPQNFN